MIIPFRIESVTPSRALSYFVAGSQWLDALPPPAEQHLQRLVEAVRYQLEHPAIGQAAARVSTERLTAHGVRAPARHRGARRLLTAVVIACSMTVGGGLFLRPGLLSTRPRPRTAALSPSTCTLAYAAHDWTAAVPACVHEATTGNGVAQRLLGVMYRQGLGISSNLDRAVAWFHRAALQGDPDAHASLRQIYDGGSAVGSSAPPYSLAELVELIKRGVEGQPLSTLARESCLDFVLDSAAVADLLVAGAKEDQVEALGSACRLPTEVGMRSRLTPEGDSVYQLPLLTRADSAVWPPLPGHFESATQDSATLATADSAEASMPDSTPVLSPDSVARADTAGRGSPTTNLAADSASAGRRVTRAPASGREGALADLATRCRDQCVAAHYRYGRALERSAQWARALDEYLSAMGARVTLKTPRGEKAYKAPVRNAAGRVLLRGGEFAEASRHFKEAVAGEKTQAAYHYNFAVALECLPDLDRAASEYAEAVRLNPLTPGARDGVLRVRAGLGACNAGAAIVERAVADLPSAKVAAPAQGGSMLHGATKAARQAAEEEAAKKAAETIKQFLNPNH